MSLPRLALAVIGDEISPSLDEMISFCTEHQVRRLDMRTLDGRNLLGMSLKEGGSIARRIEAAGLSVPTFVSPLLKWPAPGKEAADGKVDFAFDPADCPADDPLVHAFDMATVLGAERIRVFSHLRYPGYKPADLIGRFERLADLSLTYSVTVEIENEPVCNIGSLAELADFFTALQEALESNPLSGQLRPLVDIGNAWSMGAPPTDAEIAVLAPLVDLIHLKDRDLSAKRTVPLGDGDVPWAKELTRLLTEVAKAPKPVTEILASIETHCPQDARNATARSVTALRRIAAKIGVEVV
ncbi:sugar phosphate isomerase/epimerase family protein [Reyranella sp.]|uniref:sugar phosphate isomerase/epimerase family protein n=1 Tax=Reyranella sp. TaxID=1929291 RepID=UPI003C7A446B